MSGWQQLPSELQWRETQYVSASGLDAHSGSIHSPVLTVSQAVANSANYGRIVVLPGTYAGAVDASALTGLEIINLGILTHAAAHTLILGPQARLTGPGSVRSTSTGVAYRSAIKATAADDLVIEDTNIVSTCDAINLTSCNRARISRVSIVAGEYGVYAETGATHTVVEDCFITNAGWTSCSSNGLCLYADALAVLRSTRNIISVTVPVANSAHQSGALVNMGGQILDDGSSLYACEVSAGTAGWVRSVFAFAANISLWRSTVASAGNTPYDLYASGGGVITVHGAIYNAAKVNVTGGTLQAPPIPG